jgi:hypothetical protein
VCGIDRDIVNILHIFIKMSTTQRKTYTRQDKDT